MTNETVVIATKEKSVCWRNGKIKNKQKQLDFCGAFIFELLLLKCGLPLTVDTVKHGKWCFVLIKVLAIAQPLWV